MIVFSYRFCLHCSHGIIPLQSVVDHSIYINVKAEQFSSSDHVRDTNYSKMISFVLYIILSLHELSLSLSFIICAIRLPFEPGEICMSFTLKAHRPLYSIHRPSKQLKTQKAKIEINAANLNPGNCFTNNPTLTADIGSAASSFV
jgi:hypothetical protein